MIAVGFTFGVIEGFFGQAWSWAARHAWAKFLAQIGGTLYVYAPKQDRSLRRDWRLPIEPQPLAALAHCRAIYRDARVGFGVGLTPSDVQQGLSSDDQSALQQKVRQLNSLNLDFLAILFDDMRGDFPYLAAVQLEIIERVADRSNAKRLALCPTYYSDDPVLERVFGQRPQDYWGQLRSLNSAIDIFWTGPQVCSHAYTSDHLASVATRFGRPVLLWDNYPANDAQRLTSKLHIHDIGDRNARLQAGCRGQLMNPMNQAFLSQIAVATMARVHRLSLNRPPADSHEDIRMLAPPQLADLLTRDSIKFATEGLEGLSTAQREHLCQAYGCLQTPMAAEVVDWLQGRFAFDPACLTD